MVAKSNAASQDATMNSKRAHVEPGWSRRMHAARVIARCLCKPAAFSAMSVSFRRSVQIFTTLLFTVRAFKVTSLQRFQSASSNPSGTVSAVRRGGRSRSSVNVFLMLPSVWETIVIHQVIGRKCGRQPQGTREKCNCCSASREFEHVET